MYSFEDLIMAAKQNKVSDIHIAANQFIKFRISGRLEDMGSDPLTPADTEELARDIAGDKFEEFLSIGELDMASSRGSARTRINIFKAQDNISISIRLLSEVIPALDTLGLPSAVATFPQMQRGLVLVTGETGSGKSTTLAAVINDINKNRKEHIITFEDPIEYIYTPDKSLVNQREIGKDTKTFANGLRAALREDPDVILVGEMRDTETIEAAITAAETGHIVFSTLHTKSAAESVDRMIEVFPEGKQKQIRLQLSTCLNAVLSQQLVPAQNGGRVLATEMMMLNPSIRNLIREAKSHMIPNAIQTSAAEGNILMDASLMRLYQNGKITKSMMLECAHDAQGIADKL